MALTQLAPPYPIFTDKSGDPLDNGYLYFGEVNKNPETNPIQVYYDSAFTQPAAQPLRTSNGYVMRNGSPALIYAGSQFSVTIRDKNNALVIYSPVGYGVDPASITGTVTYDDFTGDGSMVTFTLSASPSTKNATNVYIDGVYQSKENYSTSGSTLTFTTAPPLNSAIEVVTQESSIIGGAGSQQISYTQGGTGSITRTVQSRLRDFVTVKDFGAVGDGVTDDTAALVAACAASTNVVIPAGMNLLISKTTLSTNYLHLVMEGDAKITISNSDLTGHGLTLTGAFMKITGGSITCSGAGYFAGFLVQVESYNCQLDTVTINYVSKANYTGDGVNIPYNTGVVRFAQPFCILKNCNVYYGEGTGITVTRENCEITSCRISNNITGIIVENGGSSGYGDNCRITDNLIYDNNAATVSLSGEDGILTYDTKGHIIADNQIWGSGEHGTYIQSTDNTITGNVIFENYSSGLKLGGGFRSTVTGNNCYDNNTGSVTDASEIYIQSPYGNSTISSNTCSNNAGTGVRGIRVVWLSGKAVAGQESRMTIDGNSITGTFSAAAIQANGYGEIVISNNTAQGQIALGQSSAGDPVVANSVLSGNRATALSVTKCSDPLIEGNHTGNLSLSSNVDNAIMRENIITAQTSRILFQTWDEFSDNIITYTETTPSNSLFEQSGSVADNSNKRILNNRFLSSGGRMISFTTDGISGNFLMVMNNEFNGAGQAIYTWGENHQIIGNRSTDGSNIGYIRGTNSIIKNNMATISIEFPASNTVGDNVTPI